MSVDAKNVQSVFGLPVPQSAVVVAVWCVVALVILFFTALLFAFTLKLGTFGDFGAQRNSSVNRVQFQAWRMGPNGPVDSAGKTDGWDSDTFKAEALIPGSNEYAFCAMSSLIAKNPTTPWSCEVLEHGNNNWSVSVVNAVCKVTCFKQTM